MKAIKWQKYEREFLPRLEQLPFDALLKIAKAGRIRFTDSDKVSKSDLLLVLDEVGETTLLRLLNERRSPKRRSVK